MNTQNINPITKLDYPDPDVIYFDGAYYMVSTTMYFMPGCEILRSYDLVNWEHASFVYDRLDGTPSQKLQGKENIYSQGMWAASLRYNKGLFYICFVANDTHKTYIFTSSSIEGPWEKYTLEGFYHDNSILFDDDGRVHIVYGNKNIFIKELAISGERLSDSDTHDTEKLIISDADDAYLGYEGSHFYKINGKYYIFLIHIPKSTGKRTESCFISDLPFGPYTGKDVCDDDRNYRSSGVAQGGIIKTPGGKWYGILFQDSGAVGRIPVLIPVHWDGDYPVFGDNGHIPESFDIEDLKPGHCYTPLVSSDDFKTKYSLQGNSSFGFKPCWQFNHEPDLSLIKRNLTDGTVTITTDKLSPNLVQAKNTLTQRTLFPESSCTVLVDGSGLNDGDYAGLCILESCYGFIAITKRHDSYYLVMGKRDITTGGIFGERHDDEPFDEMECIRIEDSVVRLQSHVEFRDDTAEFSYYEKISDTSPKKLGITHKLQFKLDHFTGARFGLFVYSTKSFGGSASFSDFKYQA